MEEAPSNCPECGRPAKVVGGLCSHCGVLRDASQAPVGALRPRYVRGSSLRDDLADFAPYVLWLVPSVAMIVLGLMFSVESLAVVGIVIVLVPALLKLLLDGLF